MGTGARLSNVILKEKSIKAAEGRQCKNLAATVSMQQCYSEYHGRTGGRATNPLLLLPLLLQLLAPPVVSTTTIPTRGGRFSFFLTMRCFGILNDAFLLIFS